MSEFRVNTLSDVAGTGPTTLTGQSAAKAWGNFTGIGTATLNGSFNLSSLTDAGVGSFRFNFANSFSDVNASGSGMSWRSGVGFGIASPYLLTTSQGYVGTATAAGAFSDNSDNGAGYHGDLA